MLLFWLFGLTLAGCQGFGPATKPSTPTPVLLPAVRSPTPTRVATATFAPTPVRTSAATATPTAVRQPQATPTTAPLLGVGKRPTLVLWAAPRADAPVATTLAGSQVVWAEARSADGRWIRVRYGDQEARAWAPCETLQIFGEIEALPVSDAEGNPVATPAGPTVAKQAAGVAPTPVATDTIPSAAGAPAAVGGRIVFQTAIGGDIYLVNADGRGLRRLTDGMDPALSPDGTRVAFARWGSPHGIFVLDLRSGEERRITSANQPRSPAWHTDGTRLAFTYVVRTRTCFDLGYACLDEATVRRMFGGRECIDTPLGRKCLADLPVVKLDDNGLAVVDLTTGDRRDLLSEGTIQSVQWRPGTDELVFRGRNGLQIIRPGEAPRPLNNDPNLGSPAWSPDGRQLAAQLRIHDRTEIVLLSSDGALIRHLTQPPPTYERPGQPPPHNVAPAWSPDGRFLLFLSDRAGAWPLYVMNAD
ncbi:MAG: hypothetical protein N2439_01455, partial [Anaerolineae bacterium]|nr:hypothetical protein [Anaerolineae bacterium]